MSDRISDEDLRKFISTDNGYERMLAEEILAERTDYDREHADRIEAQNTLRDWKEKYKNENSELLARASALVDVIADDEPEIVLLAVAGDLRRSIEKSKP